MRLENRDNNHRPGEFFSEKTFLVLKDNQLGVFEAKPGGVLYELQHKKQSQQETQPFKTQKSKPKSAAINSHANTWPPKLKKVSSSSSSCASLERPKTANLDEPSLLDPRLVHKLDMSMLSKELLSDSMTHIRLLNCGSTALVQGIERRRQSLNIPSGSRREYFRQPGWSGVVTPPVNSGIISLTSQERKSFEPLTDSELTYDLHRRKASPEVTVAATAATAATTTTTMKKQGNCGLLQRVVGSDDQAVSRRFNSEPRARDANNNNKPRTGSLTLKVSALSIGRKKSSRISIKSDVEVLIGAKNSTPEPCKACGRSDQPERFHSHPKNAKMQTLVKPRDNSAPSKSRLAVPKSVQKPVALHFRSEKGTHPKNLPPDLTPVHDEPEKKTSLKQTPVVAPSPKRGPRSVTCYICSREFGTASFPIHELKCLQKWERENNSLPPSQRRSVPPQRPEAQPGNQGWNKAAWEQSQTQLVPCPHCGRTFLPDRLSVHEKSCKIQKKHPIPKDHYHQQTVEKTRGTSSGSQVQQESPMLASREPPMVFCLICGRNFGSKSIKIHERQCLKRSQIENSESPTALYHKRNQPPLSTSSSTETPIFQKKPIPCYICGRDFGSTSIGIHEPQCLRKWHLENDKLPSSQRRQQPNKPEVVLTRDGTGAQVIDHTATAEANWHSHLRQLVPCRRCGRTFNPDRVAVHERGCKGSR